MTDQPPFELEPASGIQPVADDRPRMDEPLPVRLLTVADATLPTQTGLETKLDAFYVTLLGFARDTTDAEISYRAENFRLHFRSHESLIVREDFRALQIEIKSLQEAEHKLHEAQIEYVRQCSLTPGVERLVLKDPAGNWLELMEVRLV